MMWQEVVRRIARLKRIRIVLVILVISQRISDLYSVDLVPCGLLSLCSCFGLVVFLPLLPQEKSWHHFWRGYFRQRTRCSLFCFLQSMCDTNCGFRVRLEYFHCSWTKPTGPGIALCEWNLCVNKRNSMPMGIVFLLLLVAFIGENFLVKFSFIGGGMVDILFSMLYVIVGSRFIELYRIQTLY